MGHVFLRGAGGGLMGSSWLFKGADGKHLNQLMVWFAMTSQMSTIGSEPYAKHLVLYQIHRDDQHPLGTR